MDQIQIPPSDPIGRIRFASERKMFDSLCGDKLVAKVAERLRKNNEEETNRRRLLANALRITDRIIPSLVERIAIVKQITHLEGIDVETFIHNSPNHSASCMHFESGEAFLLISSGLYTVCCTASALAALLRHLVPGLSKRHLRTSWRGFPLRCF